MLFRVRGRTHRQAGAEVSRSDRLRLRLALARLPGSMRKALRLFRQVTGLLAVASLTTGIDEHDKLQEIAPPIHPRCGAVTRTIQELPCKRQWRMHVRRSRVTRRPHSHTCPLGLLCSCVPIFFGEALVGVAKLVADPGTPRGQFSAGSRILELSISWFTQDLYLLVLTGEMKVLEERVDRMGDALSHRLDIAGTSLMTIAPGLNRAASVNNGSLIHRALSYLDKRYLDPTVSLSGVARALRSNEKYLSHLFTQVVGERMHAYIATLRVQHASRLLLRTDMLIKQVAFASGFPTVERFLRNFRCRMGVSPGEYRRIFTGV